MAPEVESVFAQVEPDEIGPEAVIHFYDPETGLKAVVVIDTTAFGAAGGGTRMLPDITTREIRQLARAMTYKFVSLGLPRGGAKAGIWADPSLKGPAREALLRAFGRAIAPLTESGVFGTGPDMGTNNEDFNIIYEAAGRPVRTGGLLRLEREGEPLENHLTGYGVAVAAGVGCSFRGTPLAGVTAAVEGFGKVGGGAVRYLARAGARVVAISTLYGAIYDPRGLDVERLFELRRRWGDGLVEEYPRAQRLAREELLFLPVEVLVPGARPYVISEANQGRVQAKVIASGANIPLTEGAEEALFHRGVVVIPDFISNAGGILTGMASRLGLTPDQTFDAIHKGISRSTQEVLESSSRQGINPSALARQRVKEQVLQARRERRFYSAEEVLQIIKERLEAP